MICIARIFGAPETVPAGNVALTKSNAGATSPKAAAHIRDDVHDVAVTLDVHQFRHAHRAEIRDPPDIVARKIDKHDVFGAFFGIGEELGGVRFVLR